MKPFRTGTEISLISFDFDPNNAEEGNFITTLYTPTRSRTTGSRLKGLFVIQSDGFEHIYILGMPLGIWRIKTDIASALSNSAKGFKED